MLKKSFAPLSQAVQKPRWTAQKKAQGRSVFGIRKDLSFLKQRSQRGFFWQPVSRGLPFRPGKGFYFSYFLSGTESKYADEKKQRGVEKRKKIG